MFEMFSHSRLQCQLNQPNGNMSQVSADEGHPASSILDVVSIRGGGIAATKVDAWIAEPKWVNGLRFVNIDFTYKCKEFLSAGAAMVKHVRKLRNKRVAEMMQTLPSDDDPNGENVQGPSPPKRPKREMLDELPAIIKLEVLTKSGMTALVNVVPTWRDNSQVEIELNEANMDLLLMEPPAESVPWKPMIDQPNVKWHSVRQQVRCEWWDSQRLKWRRESRKVIWDQGLKEGVSDDEEAMQAAVSDAAATLQTWYTRHHNMLNNAPAESAPAPDPDED